MFRPIRFVSILALSALLCACATKFPRPESAAFEGSSGPDGVTLFQQTFEAHGGEHLDELDNVSVGITGQWKQLIRRIQPLVTDYQYRVDSQERLFPKQRVYASHYTGPGGTKSVYRSPDEIVVHYNQKASYDTEVLSSTALTADAFHLFLLGPLALEPWQDRFERISDKHHNGKLYQRIYLAREPGFGYGQTDEVVLWLDPSTRLTKMIQITLTGHETTQAAHVEVEYLAYLTKSEYTFPSQFFERVNAPIAIDAHAWELTGLKINSPYTVDNLKQPGFTGAASQTVTFDD